MLQDAVNLDQNRVATALRAVTARIVSSSMTAHPTPHMVLDDVFPDWLYARMQALWPDPDRFQSIAESGRVTKGAYKDRYTLVLTGGDLAQLPDAHRTFWGAFAAWLGGEEFLRAILAMAKDDLRARFTTDLDDQRFACRAQLIIDRTGYALGPHTDVASRIFNLLFYCPADANNRDLGTSLYAPKNRDFTCAGGPHYPRDQFDLVETVGFLPNRVLGFTRTDTSWHGVEPVNRRDVARRTLNVKIMAVAS